MGYSITRSNKGIFLDQGAYLEDLLQTASIRRVTATYLPIKPAYQPPFSLTDKEALNNNNKREALSDNNESPTTQEKAAYSEDIGKVG